MSLSRIIRTGNGTTNTFSVNFALGLISGAPTSQVTVTCRVGNEADGTGNPVYRDILWLSDNLVQISGAAPGNGVQVAFERTVIADELIVDFADGAVLNKTNLNNSIKQAIMLAHQAIDGRIGPMAQAINMGGFPIINSASGTNPNDLATRQDVVDIAGNAGEVLDEVYAVQDDINETYGLVQNLAAEAAASATQAALNPAAGFWYRNVTTLRTDTLLTYTADQPTTVVAGTSVITRAEGFAYRVAASDATDHDVITAGGVKLYVEPNGRDRNVLAFFAIGDGVTDDTAILAKTCSVAGRVVIIPRGTSIRITAEVVTAANVIVCGGGEIFVDQDPYVRGLRLGAFCTAREITFRGNGVPTGRATLTGGQMGWGISAFGVSAVRVQRCIFKSFVSPDLNTGGATIMFSNCNGMAVQDCYFDISNDGYGDISASYTAGDCLFTGNVSYSNSDSFLSISSTGGLLPGLSVSTLSHHIVTGNIAIKRRWASPVEGRHLGRHGVGVHYAGGLSYLTMANNIIGNVGRHGAYLRGPTVQADTFCGPNILAGNIFRHCGMGDALGSNYCSGIRVETTLPTTIMGNLFDKSGYRATGEVGDSPAYDIECVRGLEDVTIVNNVCSGSLTGALRLGMSVETRKITNLKIVGNTIRTAGFGISLSASSADHVMRDIKILDNYVEVTGANILGPDTVGACIFTEGGGTYTELLAHSMEIRGNTFVGSGKTGKQYGIALMTAGPRIFTTAVVRNNTFRNLQWGIASRRVGASAVASYVPHRAIGTEGVWDDNKFFSVGTVYDLPKASGTVLTVVGPGNYYDNCDAGLPGDGITTSAAVIGSAVGRDASGYTLIKFKANAAPVAQQYYAGDEIELPPVAGGRKGLVCTTSGTPGVWKAFGNIDA